MKNFLLTTLILFTIISNSFSQTTLAAGDLAIIGFNADNPDEFGFVLLVDIEAGTEITFTDSGVKSDDTFRGNEGAAKFTASSNYSAGSVITYSGYYSDLPFGDFTGANDANVGNNGVNLSASGDQIFAFQGTSSSPTFIFGFQTNSNTWQADATQSYNSALPSSLTNGVNAVAVGAGSGSGSEYDNSVYDQSVISGSKSTILSAITNNTNWNGSNTRITFNFSTYTVASPTTTWTGGTDTDWATASNWNNGVPTSSLDATIPSVGNAPIIGSSTNATTKNITLNASSNLSVSKSGSLTISGNLTNNGTLTLNSDSQNFSSLIVQGTSSGNIIYNRWINSISTGSPTSGDPGWDLVGSPVVGASLTSSNFSQNGSNYAIQPYDNSDNTWTATSSASVSTSLGAGYAMAKATAGTEAFTGTVENLDKDVNITNNSSGSGTQWNLVANPYPSYLALNSAAAAASSATTNFITQNAVTADVLGSGTNEDALWYWKGFEYGQYNNSSSAVYIAPGQGFFIASKTGGGTLKFLESMQTTTGSDDFISGDILEDNRAELFINLNQNDFIRETEIYFIEGTTDGSDPTYDARTFPMNDNTISIFTRLVEADEGVDLSIQALAYSEMWGKVIPLGVNALGGEEMTISISHRTTPADLNIYLEDTEDETITNLLDENYVLTPTSDQGGVGRFFIHMSADTMSNEEVSTSMLNAYKEIDANYITIEGLATQSNETRVSLYNILGRKVLSTTLNNNMGTQIISTIEISAGIYVIKLESESGSLTKKLLIQ